MNYRRPKKGEKSLSNVLDLSNYRKQRALPRFPVVYYINQASEWLSLLSSVPSLCIKEIHSPSALETISQVHIPDLVLVESWLDWSPPFQTIQQMSAKHQVPVVMLWQARPETAKDREQIKQAYSAGVSDILFTPLCRDEVVETLEVLLKFQHQQSLYH